MAAPPAAAAAAESYPHELTVTLPLPTPRHASIISRSLSVDDELSPLVKRKFTADNSALIIHYKATTARMLRVASNGAFESVKTLLQVCEELDLDVLEPKEI